MSLETAPFWREIAGVFDGSGDLSWTMTGGTPVTQVTARGLTGEQSLTVKTFCGGTLYRRRKGRWDWLGSGVASELFLEQVMPWLVVMKPAASFFLEARRATIGKFGRGRGAKLSTEERAFRLEITEEFKKIKLECLNNRNHKEVVNESVSLRSDDGVA